MPVIAVQSDPEALTITIHAEFAAPPDRVWAAFTDPAQLNLFWGPPGWPATFTEFELAVGAIARYHMTGPRGEQMPAAWEFTVIEPPRRLVALDRFLDDLGNVAEGMPHMRMELTFEPSPLGTAFTSTTFLDSTDALEQLVAMGALEGTQQALDQLDRVLAGLRATTEGQGTETELLDDTHARITRLIDGPIELVWRAHTEPELLRQWMLGPDGWDMTECQFDATVDATYKWVWTPQPGTEGESFGFHGTVLLVEPPRRLVTEQYLTGADAPPLVADLTLLDADGATLLVTVIEFSDAATRDEILATGMADGMEASYARMERELPFRQYSSTMGNAKAPFR